MWLNKWIDKYVGTLILPSLIACIIVMLLLLWAIATDSARLHPASREIVVRQVENGYVVEAHVQSNPYPYREMVFTRPDDVGAAVAGLLNEAVPSPRWGR